MQIHDINSRVFFLCLKIKIKNVDLDFVFFKKQISLSNEHQMYSKLLGASIFFRKKATCVEPFKIILICILLDFNF
jgi:hypothetical protein